MVAEQGLSAGDWASHKTMPLFGGSPRCHVPEALSVLLVEQNVRAAVEIADRAYVLDDGKVVYEGDAAEFGRDEQRVRELAGASAEKWDIDAPA
jgi:ABC-type phosphate/phosphonate transport system ATPase subunit